MGFSIQLSDLLMGVLPFIISFVWWSMKQDSRIKTLEVRQDNDDKVFAKMQTDLDEIKKLLHELVTQIAIISTKEELKKERT